LYRNIKRTIETDAFFLQYRHFFGEEWGLSFIISKSGYQLLPFGFVSLCNSASLRFEVEGQRPQYSVGAAMKCSHPISQHMVQISSFSPPRTIVAIKCAHQILYFEEERLISYQNIMKSGVSLEY